MVDTRIDVADVDILVAAQERATRILADARREVARAASAALGEAEQLLLEQQEVAERLLSRQLTEAAETSRRADRAVFDAPVAHKDAIAIGAADRAAELLERQEAAAESLRLSEEVEALAKREAIDRAGVKILMQAHRDAAAVLLQAKMVVEDRRHARVRSD